MTTNDSMSIIYNYFDRVTCTIIERWVNNYMRDHECSQDYALAVVLCQIFGKESKHDL